MVFKEAKNKPMVPKKWNKNKAAALVKKDDGAPMKRTDGDKKEE
jgi:hypothetical protein